MVGICKFNRYVILRIIAIFLVMALAVPVQSASKKSSKKPKTEQSDKSKKTSKKKDTKTKSTKTKSKKSSSKKSSKGKSDKKSEKQSKSRTERQKQRERVKQQAKRRAEQTKLQSSRESTDYDGIDVSSYQKDIDWDKVCRDKRIKFVYVKATEGATYTSPHFRYNIDNARKHGLKVGSYHFLRTTSSLQSQFDNFTRSVKPDEQDLVPLIDIEQRGGWTQQQIVDSLEAFARMIEKHYKCRPMIYTMTSFYNKYLASHVGRYPLFIARYSESEPVLADDAKYTLWQYTDQGTVSGIDHAVDMCRFAKGKRIADIAMRNRPSKLSDYDKIITIAEEPAIKTPAKFKSERADTTQLDLSKLSKKELKERERLLKEQQKEQQRLLKEQKKREERERKAQEKLRKKAVKDSIAAARKREKAMKDSIAATKHDTPTADATPADTTAITDNTIPADTTEVGSNAKPSKGSSYKNQFSTRRGKD